MNYFNRFAIKSTRNRHSQFRRLGGAFAPGNVLDLENSLDWLPARRAIIWFNFWCLKHFQGQMHHLNVEMENDRFLSWFDGEPLKLYHMKKYFEFILPRSHNQLIHNNKRFSFIDKLILYKFVHFMTYIVPFYTTFLREYLRKP